MKKTIRDKVIGKHTFIFNDRDNSGEGLSLETTIIDNGDGVREGIYFNQKLTLQSYCNSATFDLIGAPLTPDLLRKLADQLDAALDSAVKNLK